MKGEKRQKIMGFERVFNTQNKLSLNDIINSMYMERVDKYFTEYYALGKVNFLTSHEECEAR